ncbi:MAG: hypothetical protein JXR76_07900 [Deltaproteobacteria bacterium]|nr:hypothetical protein [Deltaproteobacteria bacterium]
MNIAEHRCLPLISFFIIFLTTACGRIGFEVRGTDSDGPTDDTQPDDTFGNDTLSDSVIFSDETDNNQLDSVSDSESVSDSDDDSAFASDTDNGSETASDSDSDTGTEFDSSTETDTTVPCPVLPFGRVILSDTDIADFVHFGESSFDLAAVTGQSFDSAWRVTTQTVSGPVVTEQLYHDIPTTIDAGDHMVVEFWARCISSASGDCHVGMLLEQGGTPWTSLVEYFSFVGTDWTFFQVPVVAEATFAAGATHETFRLGYSDQVVEIYPSQIVSYGAIDTSARPECLPDNTLLQTEVALISEPPTTATVDIRYEYFFEVNGQPKPVATATGLPAWLTLNNERRGITGIPGYEDVGTTSPITLQVASENGVDSQQFQIVVSVHPGLVGHWPLDETGGTVATDVSGNGRHGIVMGDVSWQPSDGYYDGAIRFNSYSGVYDYVLLPSDGLMDNIQYRSHTLAAWVRMESIPSGVDGSDNDFGYGILIKHGYHTGLWYNALREFHATLNFTDALYDPALEVTDSNVYHHVVARYDFDNNEFMLFVDGTPAGTAWLSGTETANDFGATQWRIGIADPSASTYAWPSDMSADDVRIYNRALTFWEIMSLADVNPNDLD